MSLYQTFARQDIVTAVPGATMSVDALEVVGIQLTAPVAWVAITVGFQVTVNGTDWVSVAAVDSASTARQTGATSTAAPGAFRVDVSGVVGLRVNVTARTSGTVGVDAAGFR